jgi:hypothetical protein
VWEFRNIFFCILLMDYPIFCSLLSLFVQYKAFFLKSMTLKVIRFCILFISFIFHTRTYVHSFIIFLISINCLSIDTPFSKMSSFLCYIGCYLSGYTCDSDMWKPSGEESVSSQKLNLETVKKDQKRRDKQ